MSKDIRTVAIVGASGNVGSAIFKKLATTYQFKVTVLRREGSSSNYPANVPCRDVNFGSVDSLKSALTGQDAVIAVLGFHAQAQQRNIIDAAIAAGVKRFLPSEFGSNSNNRNVRTLPYFAEKFKISDYLAEQARTSTLTYTIVNNGPLLDLGIRQDFLLNVTEGKATIFDGGNTLFSTTTLDTLADAVIAILSQPAATENRVVYIEDIKLTQLQLLDIVRKVAPRKTWAVEQVNLNPLIARSDERMARGLLDEETFAPYAWRSIYDSEYGGDFEKTDNELLGLSGKTKDDIEAILRGIL